MRVVEKIIILVFLGLIVSLALYIAVRSRAIDTMVILGWHTSTTPDLNYALFAVIILIPSLITYLILTSLSKLWLAFVKKMNS